MKNQVYSSRPLILPGIAFLLLGLILGLIVFTSSCSTTRAVVPPATPTPTIQCFTYTYWVINPADPNPWVQLAERQVCGIGLQDGPIVGPPRAALEAEVTRLLNELDRWVDCVREKLCTPAMKPWWEVDNASKV